MTLLAHAEDVARRKVRGAAFSLIGTIFILIGLGFLCAALWMVLSALRDPLFAAQVIGGGLVAVGLILLGTAQFVSKSPAPPEPQETPVRAADLPIAQLVEGFVIGLNAARRTRR